MSSLASVLDFVNGHGSLTLISGTLNAGLYLNQAADVRATYTDSSGLIQSGSYRLTFGDLSVRY